MGIDPGYRDGAAAIITVKSRMISGVSWHYLPRKAGNTWRITRWHPDLACTRNGVTLADAADELAMLVQRLWLPYIVVAEGLYGRGKTLERLAESVGTISGPILRKAMNVRTLDDWRPRANQWRPEVLGIPAKTPAKRASAAAVRLMPTLVQGLPTNADEHLCEAAAIARWGIGRWKMRREK